MAIIAYSKQDEYDVVHESQDCRGWTVVDQAGNSIGKVSELLVDTDRERVDSIVIDGRARIAVEDFALRDGRVVVRGVHDQTAYSQTNTVTTTTATTGAYAAMQDTSEHRQAGYISGVTRAPNENEVTVPVIEEQLQIGKRTVERGAARVRTHIEEVPVEEQVRLREEQVHVERTPVNRPAVDAEAAAAFKEGTIEVETYAEVPVVGKESRVVEEVHVGKETTERQETVRDTVKKTNVEVEEVNRDDARNRRNS